MHAIDIKQLCKTYAGGLEALKGIDLTIESGDFFALLGANGAGKSTTIGLISSLLTKTSGAIQVCGIDLDKDPVQAKQYLGLVPQEINLNIFEPCDQILLNQAGYYGIPRKEALARTHELLKQLGLWEKKNTIVRRLSGGMKRRLMIARALMHRPRVLILDEPTAGVDIEIRHSMWAFLKQTNAEGTTIILTTHYLEEAEQLCKHIAIIDKGILIKNTSTQALLATLQHQTYILNTEEPISFLPNLAPWETTQIDAYNFELRVNNKTSLNQVFDRLTGQGLRIHSLRNKTNRLEELFMDLISS
ncbi:MAG: ABC transporter ATP-binding protein [Gammaproteobacteria bacterium]|nr:ABC transporter ATP-binding protein [Gammaproteobacteria bacterium]MCH9716054.1 ABC transporter ATP-binding protein [Gammaproteobacteria bacterium]MCH9763477.1 ABC transporter ATP-binding protein [Gammaproteobacteria bacterium]